MKIVPAWKRFALGPIFFSLLAPSFACAGGLQLSPQAAQTMAKIYDGDPDAAIVVARDLQQRQPGDPLGYLLEGEALWWKTYCAACEIKWGMLDAWKRRRQPEDEAYLGLADKAINFSKAQLMKSDTADMHLYAGIAWALKTRLYGLREDRRAAARAAVNARAEFLHSLQLNPTMADATAGIGLYNYYVDTLSPLIKFLRFFMGIPGGSKERGLQQMREGIDRGVLLAVDTRFYFAKSLRTYDQKYDQAVSIAEPLSGNYPHNPVFLLLAGNLNAELGRKAAATDYFRTVLNLSIADPHCAARARDLANSFLASLR